MSNIKEIETAIQKFFPKDATTLTQAVKLITTGGNEGEYALISPIIRKYPMQTQEDFFRQYLKNYLLASCAERNSVSIDQMTCPNIEGIAKMMVDITGIPQRAEPLSEDQLKIFATAALKDSDCLPQRPFQIKIIDNLKEIVDNSHVGWRSVFDPDTQEYTKHSLKQSWEIALHLARRLGLETFTHTLQDEAYSTLPIVQSVINELTDILLASSDKISPFDNIKEYYGNIAEILEAYLSRSLAWEAMSALIAKEKGHAVGNPLRFFVDITRPSTWPIGWNGKEFLIAQPRK